MSAAAWDERSLLLEHGGPWTEEEFLALSEQPWPRLELLDGDLLVTSAPTLEHQQVARRLANRLEDAAPVGWEVAEGVNVRLRTARIYTPDVVVISRPAEVRVFDASDVPLVVEVASPTTVARDRMLKFGHYAESGIPWYLRVDLDEPSPPVVSVYHLKDGAYVEHDRAHAGQMLELSEPFPISFEPARLLRR